LAYLTAQTNNLPELAAEILEAAGLTEADIDDVAIPGTSAQSAPLRPPPIVTSTTNLIWPTVDKGENYFDKALKSGMLDADAAIEPPAGYSNGDAGGAALDSWAREAELDAEGGEIEAGGDGWDLDVQGEDEVEEVEEEEIEEDLGAGATPGIPEVEYWTRNSPQVAADHVAAGSFESAMQVRHFLDLI
jgi:coatomer subunit alpha